MPVKAAGTPTVVSDNKIHLSQVLLTHSENTLFLSPSKHAGGPTKQSFPQEAKSRACLQDWINRRLNMQFSSDFSDSDRVFRVINCAIEHG